MPKPLKHTMNMSDQATINKIKRKKEIIIIKMTTLNIYIYNRKEITSRTFGC